MLPINVVATSCYTELHFSDIVHNTSSSIWWYGSSVSDIYGNHTKISRMLSICPSQFIWQMCKIWQILNFEKKNNKNHYALQKGRDEIDHQLLFISCEMFDSDKFVSWIIHTNSSWFLRLSTDILCKQFWIFRNVITLKFLIKVRHRCSLQNKQH